MGCTECREKPEARFGEVDGWRQYMNVASDNSETNRAIGLKKGVSWRRYSCDNPATHSANSGKTQG